MLKEIGSTFWINPNIKCCENVTMNSVSYNKYGDVAFLSSGRGAQNLVLDTIEERNPNIKKIALIPAFTCTTVVNPFKKHDYQIYTYDIDTKLNVDMNQIRNIVREKDVKVILFHRYFGFDTCMQWDELIREFSEQGIVFIEDKTQCIYSNFHEFPVDYIVGSLRKWCEMPDGGIAICKDGVFHNKPCEYDKNMVNMKVQASYLKYDYIFNGRGDKSKFRELYENAATLLYDEKQYFAMSPISCMIQKNLDVENLKKRRRENYNILYQSLKKISNFELVTPNLQDGDVPLYFAFLVSHREKLQRALSAQDIYAPIIWPYEDYSLKADDSTMNVYNNILCIPVDQRYEADDMQRVVKCIQNSIL